jgi:hypothetical protein
MDCVKLDIAIKAERSALVVCKLRGLSADRSNMNAVNREIGMVCTVITNRVAVIQQRSWPLSQFVWVG